MCRNLTNEHFFCVAVRDALAPELATEWVPQLASKARLVQFLALAERVENTFHSSFDLALGLALDRDAASRPKR